MSLVTVFDQHADEYDQWFDAHESVYQAEVAALRKLVPATGLGIEVGVGTGRFAVPLRVGIGVEANRRNSQCMSTLAIWQPVPIKHRMTSLMSGATIGWPLLAERQARNRPDNFRRFVTKD